MINDIKVEIWLTTKAIISKNQLIIYNRYVLNSHYYL
jgi:hypothetical protein